LLAIHQCENRIMQCHNTAAPREIPKGTVCSVQPTATETTAPMPIGPKAQPANPEEKFRVCSRGCTCVCQEKKTPHVHHPQILNWANSPLKFEGRTPSPPRRHPNLSQNINVHTTACTVLGVGGTPKFAPFSKIRQFQEKLDIFSFKLNRLAAKWHANFFCLQN
jgi:hypothetical protein